MKDVVLFTSFFEAQYQYLYNGGDRDTERYRDEIRRFDEIYSKKEKAFVGEFAKYREDIISSDREAAAFTRAFENFKKFLKLVQA